MAAFKTEVRTGVVLAVGEGARLDFVLTPGQWDPGWTVSITDLNNDGKADILVNRADGVWVQATNTGVGTFTYVAGNWGSGWTVSASRPSDR